VKAFGARPRDLLREAMHSVGRHRAAAERETTAANAAAAPRLPVAARWGQPKRNTNA
jgi:hypothetical protein